MKKLNKKFAILQAFAILFVVLGHSKSSGSLHLMNNWFPYYSFHMALFVFVSGYFYKTDSESKPIRYIINQFRDNIAYYYFWNLIYGIIVNGLRSLNIIEFGSPMTLRSFFLNPFFGAHHYIFNLATWFVITLFLIKVINVVVRRIFRSNSLFFNMAYLMLLFLGAYLTVVYARANDIKGIAYTLVRLGFLIPWFQLGFMFKTHFEEYFSKVRATFLLPLLMTVQLFLFFIGKNLVYVVGLGIFNSDSPLAILLSTLTGILFWLKISEVLEPAIGESRVMLLVSRNTKSIMTHHLFVMFLMNWIVMLMATKLGISSYDVTMFRTDIYYQFPMSVEKLLIVYVAVMILVPVFGTEIYKKTLDSLRKK